VEFVVNDRADVARLLDAGLHLGQDDLPVAAARRVTGARTRIGFSTHNEAQLRNAPAEADYFAIGPVFATGSKANADPVVGLEKLREYRRLSAKPVVAIGGITLDNAGHVIDAGADSVAVIGGLYPDPLTPARLRERIQAWQNVLA
jgi:thiamine-phosphate pyrophosphorylase